MAPVQVSRGESRGQQVRRPVRPGRPDARQRLAAQFEPLLRPARREIHLREPDGGQGRSAAGKPRGVQHGFRLAVSPLKQVQAGQHYAHPVRGVRYIRSIRGDCLAHPVPVA